MARVSCPIQGILAAALPAFTRLVLFGTQAQLRKAKLLIRRNELALGYIPPDRVGPPQPQKIGPPHVPFRRFVSRTAAHFPRPAAILRDSIRMYGCDALAARSMAVTPGGLWIDRPGYSSVARDSSQRRRTIPW